MSTLTRIMKVTLILSAGAVLGVAAEVPATTPEPEPARQWVWLESQGVWGFGYQIQEGADAASGGSNPARNGLPSPPTPTGSPMF